ncbi:hypothetical protein QTP88_028902 [Uroleucon formosanum]
MIRAHEDPVGHLPPSTVSRLTTILDSIVADEHFLRSRGNYTDSSNQQNSGAPNVQAAHGSPTGKEVSGSQAAQVANSVLVDGVRNAGEKATMTPYSLLKIPGGRIQNQNGGFSLLFSKVQALEKVLDKIRSDPVKIAIYEILSAVKALRNSKEEVSEAYNAASISAKDAELNPVLDPPRIPTSDAGTQSLCWWEMSVPVRHVAKDRKPAIETPETAAGPPTMTQGKAQKSRTRKMKARPAGILIDVGSEADFPAVAKKIKGRMDQNTVGNNITGIRRTINGGLLIEVRGDQAAVNTVKDEACRAAGGDATIRLLHQRTKVEIRDIDAWLEKSDVADSIQG